MHKKRPIFNTFLLACNVFIFIFVMSTNKQLKQKTMKTYKQFKEEQSEIFNSFPMFFAFNDEQFHKGIEKLEVTSFSDVVRFSSGAYIRKSDQQKYISLVDSMILDKTNFLNNSENFFSAIMYELANHEFCITYDIEPTLNSLGLKEEELTKEQLQIITKAKKHYLQNCD